MSESSRIVLRPSRLSPEEARNARARAWRVIFDCYERHRGAARGMDGEDDIKSFSSEKGGPHDLAGNLVRNAEGARPNKTRKDSNAFMDS